MIRRLARPMLASVFVIDGIETLRNPQPRVEAAEPLVDKAAPLVEKGAHAVNERVNANVPPVPKDTETIIKVLAGVKIGAGVLYALGKAPRISAIALTTAHIPSTLARNAFWDEKDPAAKSRKTTGLATDVALLGALMLATVDTAGQPGLAWRARKTGQQVHNALPGVKAEAVGAGAAIAGATRSVTGHARELADTVKDKAPQYAEQVREKAPEVADQVRGQAHAVVDAVREKAPEVADQVRDQATVAREIVAERATAARETAASHAQDVDTSRARDLAAESGEKLRDLIGQVRKDLRKRTKV